MPLRCGCWKTASMYAKAMPAELKETKDGAEISYVYRLFDVAENIPGNECRVTYGIRKDGALTIHMDMKPMRRSRPMKCRNLVCCFESRSNMIK